MNRMKINGSENVSRCTQTVRLIDWSQHDMCSHRSMLCSYVVYVIFGFPKIPNLRIGTLSSRCEMNFRGCEMVYRMVDSSINLSLQCRVQNTQTCLLGLLDSHLKCIECTVCLQ